jgi:hypothetical protein
MRLQRILLASAVGLGLALLALAALTGPIVQAQQIINYRYVVNPGGADISDCRSETAPCRTVQYVLSQAGPGDRVRVADRSDLAGPAVYTGTIGITQSVTLDGAWQATCGMICDFTAVPCAPQNVVLDAQGTAWTIGVTGTPGLITPTIRCFTITGAGRVVSGTFGGGIHSQNASLTVAESVITNNVAAAYGGGIYIASGSVVITANDVLSNYATWGGGGIFLAQGVTATLYGNRIADNRTSPSGSGGAIASDRAILTATHNLLVNNRSQMAWSLSGQADRRVMLANNVVMNNVIWPYAAVEIQGYQATLVHNTIVSNTNPYTLASGTQGVWLNNTTVTLTNNLIAHNMGAGIVTGTGVVTFYITHNLFWHNGSDPITGTSAVLADPLLATDGYHVGPGSAAIGAGIDAGVTTDIDGESRLGLPDIGVDEYITRVYLPLVLRNY